MFNEQEIVKLEFKKAFIEAKKILRSKNDPLTCEIHEYFSNENDHNCIGCNLASAENLIIKNLKRYRSFKEIEEAYTHHIFLCYLMVERIYEIFKMIELPESYRLKHFRTFNLVKKWANFFKHPKAFLLVHHPVFLLENQTNFPTVNKKSIKINCDFILKYYSGDSKNKELYKLLTNKKDVYVILPDVEKLTKSFCLEVRLFVDLIRDNSVYRYLLNDKSTYENFYQDEVDDLIKLTNEPGDSK
jgi:hypothetical protein